jgi:hypothetical protein
VNLSPERNFTAPLQEIVEHERRMPVERKRTARLDFTNAARQRFC